MVDADWSRWAFYGAGWFLLLLGGRMYRHRYGRPIPSAYLILIAILILLQLYSELGF